MAGADLGFSKGGAKPKSGSLKQGVWGAQPPEAIGYLVFEVSKSEVQSTFDGSFNKMYVLLKQEVCCATSQR